MWLWVLLLILLLAVSLLIAERIRFRKLRKDLIYVRRRLDELADGMDNSRLAVVTASPELRGLLVAINELVDQARSSADNYERTENAMRTMLSNISHDLKTPLTVVLGYAEALTKDKAMTSSEREKLLERIYEKALHVLDLMNKFFDLAKLESGDGELPLERVDAADLCRHSILAYYEMLTLRGFEVSINIPTGPVWVYANPDALRRILDNLISNAVKHGADGMYLEIRLRADGPIVAIDVTDRGKGIPDPEQHRVFERLYTLADSRSRHVQGSGLGLTISKRLAERIGGTIELKSRPGIRTTFTVKLKPPASVSVPST